MLFANIFPYATPTFFLFYYEVNGTLHAIIFSKVVFPAPEAPMMAVTYPALANPEIPFNICLS